MNPKAQEFKTKTDRLNDLLKKATDGTATPDEQAEIVALDGELDALETEIKSAQSAISIASKMKSRQSFITDAVPGQVVLPGAENSDAPGQKTRMALPAKIRRFKVRSFSDESASGGFTAFEKAYRFGQWVFATIGGSEKAKKWCADNGIEVKVHTENVNSGGGYLVPEEFDNDLIDLREQYGIFRQYAKISQMKSDTKSVPRRTGGLTAFFVGEGEAAAESMKGWDRVALTAKKIMCIAKYSSELDEDSVIEIGNDLAKEIAYAFAIKEDDCGFNGDGTSPFGGIVGVKQKMLAANTPGLVIASGNSWAGITLPDFTRVTGALPQYADTPNTGWLCHKTFYHAVMEKLMLTAGGVSAAEIAAGRRTLIFMGYPVHISQKLSAASASGDIPVLFGDLSLGVTFGDRRDTTIAMSEHAQFTQDELVLRGTERFDVNVHDVGDANNPGPVVALKLQ